MLIYVFLEKLLKLYMLRVNHLNKINTKTDDLNIKIRFKNEFLLGA